MDFPVTTPTTSVPTSGPTATVPPKGTEKPSGASATLAAAPTPADAVSVTTVAGAVPATMPLAAKSTPDNAVTDFTQVFQGFAVGGQLKIGCSIPLAGGHGTLEALSSDHVKLAGHVSIAGLVNQDLDVELHKETDGTFRMTGTCSLHAAIEQHGATITITDLDSPTHHVFITAAKTGEISVKTTGMGFDRIGAHIRAH